MNQPSTLPPSQPIALKDLYSVESLDGFKKIEIVDGEWYLTEKEYYSRPEFRMTLIQTKLMVALGTHIRLNKLGKLLSGGLGFVLEGHHNAIQLMRRTDIAFVRKENLAVNVYEPYYSAPDIAVFILKEGAHEGMLRRINDFLTHGTKQVWIAYAESQQIIIHMADDTSKTYDIDDKIIGGELLNGFVLEVSKVFET